MASSWKGLTEGLCLKGADVVRGQRLPAVGKDGPFKRQYGLHGKRSCIPRTLLT